MLPATRPPGGSPMTDDKLTEQKCQACEGGTPPLQPDEARSLLGQVHEDWSMSDDGKFIQRQFKFKNFYHTIAFVNAVAWIANREDHHPDLEVGYNRCLVQFSTHAIGGLSRNDFICAAKIDALLD
jgi:4a-hydroxytetrahydrobiopterin dehydratase